MPEFKKFGKKLWSGAKDYLTHRATEEITPSITTDFAKSSTNLAIMARVRLPYYVSSEDGSEKGQVKELDDNDWMVGYMMGGFGWSLENSYSDLLPQTDLQANLTKIGLATSMFGSVLPQGLIKNDNLALQFSNKALLSLQQTMSIWTGTKKPTFSLKLLFFDGYGSSSTSVTRIAYLIERALTPYVNKLSPIEGINLFMQAPGGYRPLSRNTNSRGSTNKTYALSADGLGEVRIGSFMYFPEVICTGASIQYSDIMLDNGKPQWMEVTYNFTLWRQQVLEDLKNRYS